MKTLDIVLPVYNEEQGLPVFDGELRKVTDGLSGRYAVRIIYVVDKCSDDSFGVVRGICAQHGNTVGLQLSKRFGHQNSLMAGLSICDADCVIMMDSDMEHPPGLIPDMLERFEQGYEIVYTEREYNDSVGFLKRLSSGAFYKLINWLSDVEIKQSAADFRLISNKVLRTINSSINEQNPFLRGIFPWMGFNSTSLRYKSGRRVAGKSKYNLRRMLRFGLDGITSFSTKPLQMSVYVGVVLAFITMAYMIYVVICYLSGISMPPGWATTIVFVGFMGSLQLIVLGILGLYIGKMFDELKGRPVFIIENIAGERGKGENTEHEDEK